MRSVLLVLCFACSSVSASPAPRMRQEIISGRVVAYSGALTCLNGNGYWSMVIRVQRPKKSHSEFIRVDFSLPCDKSPEWVVIKPFVRKFHLLRQNDCDAAMAGSMDGESTQNQAMPIWKYPQGAPRDNLPFGQVIPCYHSVDLPFAPVV